MRALPPTWQGEATVFLAVNRNKRSLLLDIKSPEGKEALLRLVESADVVQSSGTESFDIAARDSALQAHFQPALQGGVAAPSQKTIVVTFSLLE